MDTEPDQLESPSAGTGFETPGQQCPPNGETRRTTTDGCLPARVGLDFGGNTLFLVEITTPPATSNTIFRQAIRKPKSNEENEQFDPGGKEEEPPPWKAAVLVIFSFLGRIWAWVLVVCAMCFCLCVSTGCVLLLSGDHFPAS